MNIIVKFAIAFTVIGAIAIVAAAGIYIATMRMVQEGKKW